MRILKLYADWCTPCKTLSNTLIGIEPELTKRNLKIENIDADKNEKLADELGVRGLPLTIILAEDNETVLFRKQGLYSKDDLLSVIDELQK